MVSGDSPAVARRRVRLALRTARERKKLTQAQVATELEWSLSKVSRIESGEVSVSGTDLQALLKLLDITDPRQVGQLIDDARVSRRQRWWADPRYREHLTHGTMQLLQFESEATALRMFHLTMIPGLFQTPDYAQFVIENSVLAEESAKVRYEVRMQRRRQVFDRTDPPSIFLILDESVLHRELGGPRVMSEQLRELIELSRQPNVLIRVCPFVATAPLALLGPFTVLDLGDEEDAVLYRESYLTDDVVHKADEIRRHRQIFEDLWRRCLDDSASARRIEARAAAMLSALDPPGPPT